MDDLVKRKQLTEETTALGGASDELPDEGRYRGNPDRKAELVAVEQRLKKVLVHVVENIAMTTTKEAKEALLEENRKLHQTLAELGVDCDEHRIGRSLQEENRRLRQDLQWSLKMRDRLRE